MFKSTRDGAITGDWYDILGPSPSSDPKFLEAVGSCQFVIMKKTQDIKDVQPTIYSPNQFHRTEAYSRKDIKNDIVFYLTCPVEGTALGD